MPDAGHPLKGPHFIVSMEGDVLGEDTPENREIVRRIHACVNACDGISTEELEKGILQDMQRVLSSVIPLLTEKGQVELNAHASQPIEAQIPPVAKQPLQDA